MMGSLGSHNVRTFEPDEVRGGAVRFTQYYLDCLSQASYLVGDETSGRAAVVDRRVEWGDRRLLTARAARLRLERPHLHGPLVGRRGGDGVGR